LFIVVVAAAPLVSNGTTVMNFMAAEAVDFAVVIAIASRVIQPTIMAREVCSWHRRRQPHHPRPQQHSAPVIMQHTHAHQLGEWAYAAYTQCERQNGSEWNRRRIRNATLAGVSAYVGYAAYTQCHKGTKRG